MTTRERNIKLFVGNLPFDATEDDISSLLHGCGQIRYLSIRRDTYTNKSKGFAHIEYRTEAESVEAFKRLIGKEIGGRVLKLDFCDDFYRDKYTDLISASIYAQEQASQQAPPEVRQPQVPLAGPPVQISPEVQPPPPVLASPPQTLPVLPQIAVPLPVPVPVSVPIPPVPVVPGPPAYQPTPVVPEYTEVKPEPKRAKLEPDVLIQNGKVVSKDLFYIIKRMTMLDVYNLVKKIDGLMERSPNTARSILNLNPYMHSSLIHAKLLLGYKDLNFTNLSNVDFSNLLEYFVIH